VVAPACAFPFMGLPSFVQLVAGGVPHMHACGHLLECVPSTGRFLASLVAGGVPHMHACGYLLDCVPSTGRVLTSHNITEVGLTTGSRADVLDVDSEIRNGARGWTCAAVAAGSP
jgi:ferredoxin